MSNKILYLSKGVSASSTRYRALQYFPLFTSAGFEPMHAPISGGIINFLKALFFAYQADTVVLLRKTFPAPLFWLLRKVSKKLIFELDDAIFSNTDGSYSKTRMSRFIKTIQQCDMVLAGNQYLADTAKKHQKRTHVIPTSLNTKKYTRVSEFHSDDFVLVWIGSRSTKKYIAGILPAIESAAKSIPQLSLKIIADFELKSEDVTIYNVPWSEESEAEEVNSASIGLAPLPPDNWTKGKCALKILQYFSAELPVIASPTSANAYIVEDLRSGYLADTQEKWAKAIVTAYEQRDHLKTMGIYAKKKVSTEYDIEIVFQKMLEKFQ